MGQLLVVVVVVVAVWWGGVVVLHFPCCMGFSLVMESGGYSPLAVHGLLTAVASLVAAHRF